MHPTFVSLYWKKIQETKHHIIFILNQFKMKMDVTSCSVSFFVIFRFLSTEIEDNIRSFFFIRYNISP